MRNTENTIKAIKELKAKYPSPSGFGMYIKHNKQFLYSDLYKRIIKYTYFLPLNASISERIYCLLNSIKEVQKCTDQNCNSNVNFLSISRGYSKYCSHECQRRNVNATAQETWKKNYGVDNPSKSKKVQKKMKKTFINNYGVDNPNRTEAVRDKIRETCNERYNADSPFESKKIKKKIKKTLIKNYGVDNPSKSKQIKNKKIETSIKNHGISHHMKSDKILNKALQTNKKRYGVEHPIQNKAIRQKLEETCKERYGYSCATKNDSIIAKIKKTKNIDYYPTFIKKLKRKKLKLLTSKSDYIAGNIDLKVKCLNCKNVITTDIRDVQKIYCKKCCKNISYTEFAVQKFLKSNNIKFEANKYFSVKDKRYEADLYLPEHNIVIEINGEYWHSDLFKDRYYHINKTEFFDNLNIRTIHIFQSEWANKKNILKSMIKNMVGLSKFKLYARKCKVDNVSNSDYKLFLEKNHIQGYIPAKYKLGLYYQNKLVSVISLGMSRFNKNEIELLRFCTRKNYNVVGGFSKLLTHATKQYSLSDIVTYCDRRFFTGNGYIASGFKQNAISKPGYYYYNDKTKTLEHRLNFQKHKLYKILKDFDEEKTEYENMMNNGYYRVWDCGQLKFNYTTTH